MSHSPIDFKTALRLDLTARQMNERAFGECIGVTQQAISKWIKRGYPPVYRWAQIKDVLGPGSYTARLHLPALTGAGRRLRIDAPINVPPVLETDPCGLHRVASDNMGKPEGETAAWDRVVGLLPEHLRPSPYRTTLQAGRIIATVDLVATRLALDFVTSPEEVAPPNISQHLLKLAALHASDPSLRVVLCVLAPNGASAMRLRISYGESLGVETWVLASTEEAARRIEQAIHDQPEPPDFAE